MSGPKELFMDIPLAKLAVLNEVLQQKSVSGAARKFGLSQSSVSNTLARLRVTFGDELIQFDGRRPTLTQQGCRLAKHLPEICMECAGLAQRQVFDPGTSTARFRVIASDYMALALAPELLVQLRQRAPNFEVTIDVLSNQSPDHFGAIDQYELYLAWFRDPPASWFTRTLFEDRLAIIACQHNAQVFEGLSPGDLCEMKHVAVEPQNPHNLSIIDRQLKEQGWRREVAVWTSGFNLIPRIVGGSDLVAFMPEGHAQLLHQGAGVKVIPSPVLLQPLRYSLMWPQRMQQDSAHRWFRNLILEAAKVLRPPNMRDLDN